MPLDTLKSRRQQPNEYLGGGNGLATNTQIIKQADVVLGLHLVEGVMPVGVKEPNWRYYESRTEHGSSLSAYAYAVVGAEIGELDRAYEYFMETATIDLTGRSKQYVGTLYVDGTHAAANAAAWGIVVSGFCGIRFRDDVLSVDPHLPPRWKEVVVPIVYRGQELRVRVRHDLVEVKPATALSARIRVELRGRTHELPAAGIEAWYDERRR